MSVLQVTLYHLLKLFQSDSSAMPKKTVVSEFYDEMVGFVQTHSPGGSMGFDVLLQWLIIHDAYSFKALLVFLVASSFFISFFDLPSLQIFQDPTAMMQQLLTTSRQLTLGAYKHETECEYSTSTPPTVLSPHWAVMPLSCPPIGQRRQQEAMITLLCGRV